MLLLLSAMDKMSALSVFVNLVGNFAAISYGAYEIYTAKMIQNIQLPITTEQPSGPPIKCSNNQDLTCLPSVL